MYNKPIIMYTSTNLSKILTLILVSVLFINVSAQDKIYPNGLVNWKFQTRGPVYSAPLIQNEIIYVGSLDSTFYAVNAADGSLIWTYKCAGIISSNATVAGDKIVVEGGNILYAFTLKGKVAWKTQLNENKDSGKIDPWDFHRSSPAVYEGRVFIGSDNGVIYVVNTENGSIEDKIQTKHKHLIRSTPIVVENMLYFGDWEGIMYAYSLVRKEFHWEFDSRKEKSFEYWKNSILETPLYHKGNLYFAGRSAALYCVDAKNGKLKWIQRSPTDQWMLGSPVIEGEALYLGSSDQHLYQAFNIETGEVLWSTKVDGRTWGTALVKNDNIYIGGVNFFKIDKKTGKIAGQIKFEKIHEDQQFGQYTERTSNFHSSPKPFKTNLIIGSDDGFIYSLKSF